MTLKNITICNMNGAYIKQVEYDPVYLLCDGAKRSILTPPLQHETNQIEGALKDAGCKVQKVDLRWPRDAFSSAGNRYFTPGFFSKSKFSDKFEPYSWVGEGGAVVPGNGFVVVAYMFVEDYHRNEAEMALRQLFSSDVHFINPFKFNYREDVSHIDVLVGCVPSAKVITVDKRYYDAQKDDFMSLAKKTGCGVVPIDTGDEFDFWGNNYLVVEEQDKIVINNQAATRVNAELKNLGVNVIETREPILSPPLTRGSVRCRTNRLGNISLLEDLYLLEDVYEEVDARVGAT